MKAKQHVHDFISSYLEYSNDERITLLKQPRWIGYPRAQQILGKLEDLLKHPKEDRMPNMLLIGNSNNGKTKLIRHFLKQHPIDENINGDHIIAPVIYMEAPPSPSEAGFYSELLNILFEKVPVSSVEAKRTRVIQVLEAIQLKMLIIDELHNILAGTSIKQQLFLNMIKFLGNKLKISIVGCGTSDLLRAICKNACTCTLIRIPCAHLLAFNVHTQWHLNAHLFIPSCKNNGQKKHQHYDAFIINKKLRVS